jgi:predicted transcriptional regulator of viral defense system
LVNSAGRVADAVQRLKQLFQEGPSARLTVEDAARVSGLDPVLCGDVLMALEDARFISRERDGRYVRQDGHAGSESPH